MSQSSYHKSLAIYLVAICVLLLVVALYQLGAAATVDKPSRQCDIDTGEAIHGSPIWEDIDADSDTELILGSNSGTLWVYDVGTGGCSLKWSKTFPDKIKGQAAVADLDGDGTPTIFIGGHWGNLTAIAPDGTVLDGYATGRINSAAVTINNIDDDADREILVGSDYSEFYALTFDGSAFALDWSHTAPLGNKYSPAQDQTIPVADVDDDGRSEAALGYGNQSALTVGVQLIDGNGTVQWTREWTDADRYTRASPLIVKGDVLVALGEESATPGTTSRLVRLSGSDGSEVWNRSLPDDSDQPDDPWPSMVATDLKQDGSLEILVPMHGDYLLAHSFANGSQVARWDVDPSTNNPYNNRLNVESEPSVSDVNADGKLEVVVGTNDDAVVILSNDLEEIRRLEEPNSLDEDFEGSPAIDDADNDDKLEMAIGSFDGSIIVWEFPAEGAGPSWPYGLGRDTTQKNIGILDPSQLGPHGSLPAVISLDQQLIDAGGATVTPSDPGIFSFGVYPTATVSSEVPIPSDRSSVRVRFDDADSKLAAEEAASEIGDGASMSFATTVECGGEKYPVLVSKTSSSGLDPPVGRYIKDDPHVRITQLPQECSGSTAPVDMTVNAGFFDQLQTYSYRTYVGVRFGI